MIGIETILLEFRQLSPAEFNRWIAQAWIRPRGAPGSYSFDEIDVARIRLILELRETMEVNDAALPTVLSLLDQLYDMRRRMRHLNQALASTMPEEVRARLLEAMSQTP
jgi:chaperone modulatory protein CbpM